MSSYHDPANQSASPVEQVDRDQHSARGSGLCLARRDLERAALQSELLIQKLAGAADLRAEPAAEHRVKKNPETMVCSSLRRSRLNNDLRRSRPNMRLAA